MNIVNISSSGAINITVNTTQKIQALNKKLKLMGQAMKYLLKKFLGHETASSMVVWTTKFFREIFENPPARSYIFNLSFLQACQFL